MDISLRLFLLLWTTLCEAMATNECEVAKTPAGFINRSIDQSINQSIYLSICLSIYLSIIIMKAKIIVTLYINKKAMLSQGNRAMPL